MKDKKKIQGQHNNVHTWRPAGHAGHLKLLQCWRCRYQLCPLVMVKPCVELGHKFSMSKFSEASKMFISWYGSKGVRIIDDHYGLDLIMAAELYGRRYGIQSHLTHKHKHARNDSEL